MVTTPMLITQYGQQIMFFTDFFDTMFSFGVTYCNY